MLIRNYALHLLLAGAALLVNSAAFASAPGTLDTSFNGDGLVVSGFGANDAWGQAVIQQPDGKLVVAGYVSTPTPANPNKTDLLLIRYNATTGSRDTTFGVNGARLVSYGGGIRATSLARQPDGKIVAAGWVNANVTDTTSTDVMAVVRVNANGSLDASFGDGGVATAVVGTARARTFGVVSRSDGSVLVAGYTSTAGANKEDFLLVHFKNNGKVDTAFGSGGGVLTDISSDTDKAYAITKQSDGKLLLVGAANVDANGVRSFDFALARYTPSGKADGTFGASGKKTTAFSAGDDATAYAALQQRDGRLVVVGKSAALGGGDYDIAVARYLPNGSLDNSFSGDGKVLTDFGGNDDIAIGVIQQFDGKLLVSGTSGSNAALVRYNTNGTLDASFGVGGKLLTSSTFLLQMNSMVQQADGQVVLAGYTYYAGKYVVAMIRYLFDDDDDDGVVDTDDNCQFVANTDQANIDGDDFGDVCDDDRDGDGFNNNVDVFPDNPAEWLDTDGDGIGNNADPDDDNDGVPDVDDPFPLDPFLLNRVSGDSKTDYAGYSVAMLGDIDGDGFSEALIGVPKNDVVLPGKTKSSKDVGSAYVSSGDPGLTGLPLHTFDGKAVGDEFGSAVALVGDVNNDGTPDIAIGAPKADQLDPITGKILVKDSGAVTVYSGADFSVLFTLLGSAAGDGFGISVTAAGDVDGDLFDDIVVGAWKADGFDIGTQKPLKDAGAAYLYSGQIAINSTQAAAQLHKFEGEAAGDYFGYSVAAGSDLNHDTISEVSIGAYKHDPLDAITNKKRTDAGSVYVYSSTPPYTLVKQLDGAVKGDNFGFAQVAINNGQDAFADLLVGSPRADVKTNKTYADAGQVALFTSTAGTPAYAIHATNLQTGARFGSAVAAAGDVDAANGIDFIVGAPKTDVIGIDGKKLIDAGQASVHRADNGAAVFVYPGRYKAGQAGFSVSGGSDHNNDGYSDVLIGSPFAKVGNLSKAGVAEVISGKEASAAAIP